MQSRNHECDKNYNGKRKGVVQYSKVKYGHSWWINSEPLQYLEILFRIFGHYSYSATLFFKIKWRKVD
jgi:hypothetical protein